MCLPAETSSPPPGFREGCHLRLQNTTSASLREDAHAIACLSYFVPVDSQSPFVHLNAFIATLFKLASDDRQERERRPRGRARAARLIYGDDLLCLEGDADDAVPDKDTDIKPRHYGGGKSHGLERDANGSTGNPGEPTKSRIGAYSEETIDSDEEEDDYDLDGERDSGVGRWRKPLVRSITCWTLGRYVNWTTQSISEEHRNQYFVPTIEGLLRIVLDNNKCVQEAGCSAFTTLGGDTGIGLAPCATGLELGKEDLSNLQECWKEWGAMSGRGKQSLYPWYTPGAAGRK
ncbi:hypothetical protein B0H16DRAFT_1884214 [Mycena metata]|uniref:Uncharacterized protein n=1 Tax=Mycena metata TaxID=1033252 RepID=A0AAD7JC02_9AGAR|nr:hypothetical protein B0H16DRAFT_1884214 [Mycena metata]